MKYLAILKDSVREAIDTKVFYVMVGLSGLLILLVASLSFTPASAEDLMRLLAEQLSTEALKPGKGPGGKRDAHHIVCRVTKVEALDKEGDPAAARYRVAVTAIPMNVGGFFGAPRAPKAEPEAGDKGAEQTSAKDRQVLEERFGQYAGLQVLEVTDVHAVPSESQTFELATRPTVRTRQFWPYQPSLFFGLIPMGGLKQPLGLQVYFIENLLVKGMGAWLALLLSVIITAFFIPNMLRKGTIDLLLAKPIHRWSLLVYKYIGGLAFIFLNTAFAVGGVWLALGLRTGIWAPSFLLVIPVITFFFAILYAVSTLFGVMTRSPIVAILMTCGFWFLLYLVGQAYTFFQMWPQIEAARGVPVEERISEGWWVTVIDVIHFALPRTTDLDLLMSKILVTDLITPETLTAEGLQSVDISWGESISVSLAFIGVMLAASCGWFVTRDY